MLLFLILTTPQSHKITILSFLYHFRFLFRFLGWHGWRLLITWAQGRRPPRKDAIKWTLKNNKRQLIPPCTWNELFSQEKENYWQRHNHHVHINKFYMTSRPCMGLIDRLFILKKRGGKFRRQHNRSMNHDEIFEKRNE